MPSKPDVKRAQQREYCARPDVKARRAETHAIWSASNHDRKLTNEARRRLERRASCLVGTIRTRARKRGLEFDLDSHVEDIQRRIDAGLCELTGLPFDLSPGRKFNSPSIDRINPSLGYTYSNVRVVLNIANVAMGDWGEDVLRSVMSAWLR